MRPTPTTTDPSFLPYQSSTHSPSLYRIICGRELVHTGNARDPNSRNGGITVESEHLFGDILPCQPTTAIPVHAAS